MTLTMWDDLVRDETQERFLSALAKASEIVAPQFAHAIEASDKNSFIDRVAVLTPVIERKVMAACADDPVLFASIHASVMSQWEDDFDRIQRHRLTRRQAEQQRSNAPRAARRRQQREAGVAPRDFKPGDLLGDMEIAEVDPEEGSSSGVYVTFSDGHRSFFSGDTQYAITRAARRRTAVERVRCNCESELCPLPHTPGRCQETTPAGTNLVDMIGETCDGCYPDYRDSGYAVTSLGYPVTSRRRTAAGYNKNVRSVVLKDGTVIPDVMGTDPDGEGGVWWVGYTADGERKRWRESDIAKVNDVEYNLQTSWVDESMDKQNSPRNASRRTAEMIRKEIPEGSEPYPWGRVYYQCSQCGYPFETAECTNPMCRESKGADRVQWLDEKAQAYQDEQERIRQRNRMWEQSFQPRASKTAGAIENIKAMTDVAALEKLIRDNIQMMDNWANSSGASFAATDQVEAQNEAARERLRELGAWDSTRWAKRHASKAKTASDLGSVVFEPDADLDYMVRRMHETAAEEGGQWSLWPYKDGGFGLHPGAPSGRVPREAEGEALATTAGRKMAGFSDRHLVASEPGNLTAALRDARYWIWTAASGDDGERVQFQWGIEYQPEPGFHYDVRVSMSASDADEYQDTAMWEASVWLTTTGVDRGSGWNSAASFNAAQEAAIQWTHKTINELVQADLPKARQQRGASLKTAASGAYANGYISGWDDASKDRVMYPFRSGTESADGYSAGVRQFRSGQPVPVDIAQAANDYNDAAEAEWRQEQYADGNFGDADPSGIIMGASRRQASKAKSLAQIDADLRQRGIFSRTVPGTRTALTVVHTAGVFHWAVTDDEGGEEKDSGSGATVRDVLEEAWDALNKVLDHEPPPTEEVAQQVEQAADAAGEAVEEVGGTAPDDGDSTGGTDGDAAPADGDAPKPPEKGADDAQPDAKPDADGDKPAPAAADEGKGGDEASPGVDDPDATNPDAPGAGDDTPNDVVETAEDVSGGDVVAIDPTSMTTGQRSNMTYTLGDGTTGNVEVTFVREDNGIFYFDGPAGEFGIGDRDGSWVDSEGNKFDFADGDAMEEVTGEDVADDASVTDIDIDAEIDGDEPKDGDKAEDDDDDEDDEDDDFKKKFSAIEASMRGTPGLAPERASALARRAARLAVEMGK